MDPHQLAELRSRAFHREVARRLQAEPGLRDRVLRQARRLPDEGGDASYRIRWLKRLEGPLPELLCFLDADDEEARALRQCTPFAGVLSPQDRWALWKRVKRQVDQEKLS